MCRERPRHGIKSCCISKKKIKVKTEIKGIYTEKVELKLSLFTDDMTICVKNLQNLLETKSIVKTKSNNLHTSN